MGVVSNKLGSLTVRSQEMIEESIIPVKGVEKVKLRTVF